MFCDNFNSGKSGLPLKRLPWYLDAQFYQFQWKASTYLREEWLGFGGNNKEHVVLRIKQKILSCEYIEFYFCNFFSAINILNIILNFSSFKFIIYNKIFKSKQLYSNYENFFSEQYNFVGCGLWKYILENAINCNNIYK